MNDMGQHLYTGVQKKEQKPCNSLKCSIINQCNATSFKFAVELDINIDICMK